MQQLSKIVRLLAVIGWIASLMLISPTRAFACSCAMPTSVSAELRNSGAVFAGKVIRSESTGSMFSAYHQMSVTFQVSEVWKGPVEDTIVVTTGMGGGDCGSGFVMDEEYLVFAYGTGPYGTSMCSRTALLSAATEDLEELGEGEIPPPSTRVSSFGVLPLAIAMCGAVMLGMFAAAFVIYRRMSRAQT